MIIVMKKEASRQDIEEVIQRVEQANHAYQLILDAETTPKEILRQLVAADVDVRRFEVATPPLEEIFISVVEGDR